MLDSIARALFAFDSNPIFQLERRKLVWLHDHSSLTRFAKVAWIVAAVATVVVWIISALLTGGDIYFQIKFVVFVLVIALVAMIVVDLFTTLTTANVLYRQLHSEQWDLLRITGQRDRSILQVEYTLAQLRAWRPITIEIAIRIALIVLILLNCLRFLVGPDSMIPRLLSFTTWPIIALTAIGVAIYLLEPLWRMKALAAFSLAVAASARNSMFAYLTLFGTTSIVHILQITGLVLIWFLVVGPISGNDEAVIVLVCFALPLATVFLICSTYVLYKQACKYWLKVAHRRIFMRLD